MTTSDPLADIQLRLREFAAERDWEQFHTPKNLAMALSVEAAELLEIFQWLTPDQSAAIGGDADTLHRVGEEVADVAIYLLRLADLLGIDVLAAIGAKINANAERYPAEVVRGRADLRPADA